MRRTTSIASALFTCCVLLASCIGATGTLPVLVSVESPYTMDKTIYNIKRSLRDNNFRFLREQTLKEGLEGSQDLRFRVLYFCNFSLAYQVIQRDKRIGIMLPCKLTLIEQAGKVTIHYLNPQLVKDLGMRSLQGMCEQTAASLENVIEEAVL